MIPNNICKDTNGYINIRFEDKNDSGTTIEEVIDLLVDRLKKNHSSREISLAITNLQQARMWLEEQKRT